MRHRVHEFAQRCLFSSGVLMLSNAFCKVSIFWNAFSVSWLASDASRSSFFDDSLVAAMKTAVVFFRSDSVMSSSCSPYALKTALRSFRVSASGSSPYAAMISRATFGSNSSFSRISRRASRSTAFDSRDAAFCSFCGSVSLRGASGVTSKRILSCYSTKEVRGYVPRGHRALPDPLFP